MLVVLVCVKGSGNGIGGGGGCLLIRKMVVTWLEHFHHDGLTASAFRTSALSAHNRAIWGAAFGIVFRPCTEKTGARGLMILYMELTVT